MRTSEHIDQLASALAAAQGEFISPERNREVRVAMKNGGSYTFRYTTFDFVLDMARPHLAKNGLSITQPVTIRDGDLVVITRLMHASGQWQEAELAVMLNTSDPQAIGSLITYLKRYAFNSMLGIASDEDDDGNMGSGNEITGMQERGKERPACPKCGKKDGVIKGKEEYGGGWVCFAKKGGCGHKWHDETKPAEPAEQQPSNADLDRLTAIKARFARAWTQAALDALVGELREEPSQWIKSQAQDAFREARDRVGLLAPPGQGQFSDEHWGAVLDEIVKTPDLKDFMDAYDQLLSSRPDAVSEEQRQQVMAEMARREKRK